MHGLRATLEHGVGEKAVNAQYPLDDGVSCAEASGPWRNTVSCSAQSPTHLILDLGVQM